MKQHNKLFFYLAFVLLSIYFNEVYAARTRKFGSKKTYTQKAPYEGFGKKSTVNGKIKTKAVKGHYKPSNGYKFVNPYSKSS